MLAGTSLDRHLEPLPFTLWTVALTSSPLRARIDPLYMRKVTQVVINSFLRHSGAKVGNTHTDGETLFLHGNPIAKHVPGGISIQTCGWKSATTKERLNGLPGVSIVQKAGKWYLNGEEWNSEPVTISQH